MIGKYGYVFKEFTMCNFFEKLIGRIYKILPMYEEDNPTLSQYVESLILEISGMYSLLNEDIEILSLLSNLEGLKTVLELDLATHKQVKSLVLKSTNDIKILKTFYGEGGK